MNNIARFFTIYWCIYFPTCIAYNELPGFSSIDEAMTGIIVVYRVGINSSVRDSVSKIELCGDRI